MDWNSFFFFAFEYPIFTVPLTIKTILFLLNCLCTSLEKSVVHLHRSLFLDSVLCSISRLSILMSVSHFLMTVNFIKTPEWYGVNHPTLFSSELFGYFYMQTLLCFHMNFLIHSPISVERPIAILMSMAIHLQISEGRVVILTRQSHSFLYSRLSTWHHFLSAWRTFFSTSCTGLG